MCELVFCSICSKKLRYNCCPLTDVCLPPSPCPVVCVECKNVAKWIVQNQSLVANSIQCFFELISSPPPAVFHPDDSSERTAPKEICHLCSKSDGELPIRLLTCGHFWHANCLKIYLEMERQLSNATMDICWCKKSFSNRINPT